MCSLSLFHYSEYLVTAINNPRSLSLDSFLLNHSFEYNLAALSSWVEFTLEKLLFPGRPPCRSPWLCPCTQLAPGPPVRQQSAGDPCLADLAAREGFAVALISPCSKPLGFDLGGWREHALALTHVADLQPFSARAVQAALLVQRVMLQLHLGVLV